MFDILHNAISNDPEGVQRRLNGEPMETITLHFTPQQWQTLQTRSKETGVSIGETVRRAVNSYASQQVPVAA